MFPEEHRKRAHSLIELHRADQEGQASKRSDEAGCDGQRFLEAFDSADGDDVEVPIEILSTNVLYIDIRQCNSADNFSEESGLLQVRLDQSNVNVRGPEFDGDARESGPGADVGESRRQRAFGFACVLLRG